MRVHIYRRKGETPNWHAQAYVGGKRYRFSCQTDDKETAREFARLRIAELKARHNRRLIGLPEPVRMSVVFERYEREYAPRLRPASQERMMHVVKAAHRWFVEGPLHDCHVSSITPNDVQAFLERKRAEGVSSRTVNLYRANLHRVFQLCVRPWLLIPYNPVAATEVLREECREPLLPTIDQYHELLSATTSHAMLHVFVTLAWETGARSGELLQLEWEDVDFDRRFLTFANDPTRGRQTKGVALGPCHSPMRRCGRSVNTPLHSDSPPRSHASCSSTSLARAASLGRVFRRFTWASSVRPRRSDSRPSAHMTCGMRS
jgi:integrase